MGSSLWQSQPLEASRPSLELVRQKATKLNADRRRELVVMGGAVCLAVMVLAAVFLLPSTKAPALVYVMRIATVLLAVGAVFILMQISRRTRKVLPGKREQVVTSMEAYRVELERRRDYYLYMGSWHALWPILPSITMMVVAIAVLDPLPNRLWRACILSLLAIAGMWIGFAVYGKKARQFQRELDALQTLGN